MIELSLSLLCQYKVNSITFPDPLKGKATHHRFAPKGGVIEIHEINRLRCFVNRLVVARTQGDKEVWKETIAEQMIAVTSLDQTFTEVMLPTLQACSLNNPVLIQHGYLSL